MRALLCVGLGSLLQLAEGHGSLIYPLPRNGVDRNVEPFKSGGWPKGHYTCRSNSLPVPLPASPPACFPPSISPPPL